MNRKSQSKDNVNARKRFKERYHTDPEFKRKRVDQYKAYRKKMKASKSVFMDAFRKDGCLFCKEKTPCVLAAHHVNPKDKKYSIAVLYSRGHSLVRFKEELAKCVCLCHNCHSKLHNGLLILPNSIKIDIDNDGGSVI